jgi:hypothetical protein
MVQNDVQQLLASLLQESAIFSSQCNFNKVGQATLHCFNLDHWFKFFCIIDVQTSMTSVRSIVLVHKRQNHCTVAIANSMASNITVHFV